MKVTTHRRARLTANLLCCGALASSTAIASELAFSKELGPGSVLQVERTEVPLAPAPPGRDETGWPFDFRPHTRLRYDFVLVQARDRRQLWSTTHLVGRGGIVMSQD